MRKSQKDNIERPRCWSGAACVRYEVNVWSLSQHLKMGRCFTSKVDCLTGKGSLNVLNEHETLPTISHQKLNRTGKAWENSCFKWCSFSWRCHGRVIASNQFSAFLQRNFSYSTSETQFLHAVVILNGF